MVTTNLYSDYIFDIGKNHFKGLIGFNSETLTETELSARRNDVISDSSPWINAATGQDYTSGWMQDWAVAGFFGRINYDYDNRYLLEANLRYDGSSRFVGNKRWNWFPSFSLGWNIALESFWEPFTEYVSTFKPRISWGKLGNQNTSDFYPFYQSQPMGIKNGNWLIGGELPNTATAPLMVSSMMSWETVNSLNFGLDINMLKNRLGLVAEWYERNTEDMIGPPEETSSVVGIAAGSLPRINNASLRVRGWELTVDWKDKIKNVNYHISFNVNDIYYSKITKYPNVSKSLTTYYVGMDFGEIWGYETEGIAKTDEEMQNWLSHTDQSLLGSRWGAGDVMYRDISGNGKINTGANTKDDPGSRRVIGNNTSRYQFGCLLAADWKGFDFSMFLQGTAKRDIWLDGNYFWGMHNSGMWQSVGYKEHIDFFRPEGHELGANLNGYFPKPYFANGAKNKHVQSRYLQNAAFIRLKNLQLGYTLSTRVTQQVSISKLRVFLSGENLWTASPIFGTFDPEALNGPYGSGKIYPLSRIISCGINITF